MKIKKAEELVNVLINDFSAVISSADEINTYPQYSLENDNEHDYKLLYKVLKMNYAESLVNPYDVIFYIIFSKNGGIFEVELFTCIYFIENFCIKLVGDNCQHMDGDVSEKTVYAFCCGGFLNRG